MSFFRRFFDARAAWRDGYETAQLLQESARHIAEDVAYHRGYKDGRESLFHTWVRDRAGDPTRVIHLSPDPERPGYLRPAANDE
jgi:hypothetical protein